MKKKKFKQQKVIKRDALDLFIPDPSAKTFVGVYYYMHGRFALYNQECLRRNLLPRIRVAFFDHGFSPVDASKVPKLVIGFSQKRSMQFKALRVHLISRATLQIRPLTILVHSCSRIDPWWISC